MQRSDLAAAALCGLLVTTGAAVPPEAGNDGARLTVLLDRMKRVATLYRDLALKFECTEAIQYRVSGSEDWNPPTGYVKLSYLYERDDEGRLQDCRMWPKSITNAGNYRCVAPAEYKVPLYLNNAYSWIFVFLDVRQPWHEFRIHGDDKALGRPAVVVDFAPRGMIRAEFNDWYGRAWIDRDTYQFLRVEAYLPDDFKAKQELEQARLRPPKADEEGPNFEIESVVTEFGEVRNGMRFASRVLLRRSRYLWETDYKEKVSIQVEQTYTRYRFYDVATSEAIQKIVKGEPASP